MKASSHPVWHDEAQIICACGSMFSVGSTKDTIRIEVCSKCHPFFTGETRYVDTMGRVERFQKKQAHAETVIAKKVVRKKQEEEKERNPKSLREMLLSLQKQ